MRGRGHFLLVNVKNCVPIPKGSSFVLQLVKFSTFASYFKKVTVSGKIDKKNAKAKSWGTRAAGKTIFMGCKGIIRFLKELLSQNTDGG